MITREPEAEAEPLAKPTEVRYSISIFHIPDSDILAPNTLGDSTLTLSFNERPAEPYRSMYGCSRNAQTRQVRFRGPSS